jgi:hypothetical protein
MSVGSSRKRHKRGVKQINWEEFGYKVVDEVYNAVIHWCLNNYRGDALVKCLEHYSKKSLYEVANDFISFIDVSFEDLKLLKQMPKDIYRKCEEELRMMLEEDIEEFRRE